MTDRQAIHHTLQKHSFHELISLNNESVKHPSRRSTLIISRFYVTTKIFLQQHRKDAKQLRCSRGENWCKDAKHVKDKSPNYATDLTLIFETAKLLQEPGLPISPKTERSISRRAGTTLAVSFFTLQRRKNFSAGGEKRRRRQMLRGLSGYTSASATRRETSDLGLIISLAGAVFWSKFFVRFKRR